MDPMESKQADSDRHSDLLAELARLQAAVEQLRTQIASSSGAVSAEAIAPAARSSRRQVIRRGAIALGAGVAAAAASGRPSAALDGDPMTVGAAHSGTGSTSVRSTGAGADALFGNAVASSGQSWGVRGESASFIGIGVRGSATSPTGSTVGVRGSAQSLDGVGVLGDNSATSGEAIGVQGTSASSDGIGVEGVATGTSAGIASGVRGSSSSPSGHGVLGRADDPAGTGAGVIGTTDSPSGYGMIAFNGSGTGLNVTSVSGVAVEVFGERAAFLIGSSGLAPHVVAAGRRRAGEILLDDDENLWFCVADGEPGEWRKLAGRHSAGAVHAVDPFRVYDSRLSGGPLPAKSNRRVSVKDTIDIGSGAVDQPDAVPSRATAVMLNLTCTQTVSAGWLAVGPGNASAPGSSTINWSAPGQTFANATMVKLDAKRRVKVFAGGPKGAQAEFLIDVTGYMI